MEDNSPAVQTNLLSIDDVPQEVEGILSACVAWAPAQHSSQVVSYCWQDFNVQLPVLKQEQSFDIEINFMSKTKPDG